MRKLFHTLSLLFLSVAGFTYAQEADQVEQPAPAYEINVTADRLEEPADKKTDSVTTITREEIEERQWHYLNDVLRQIPGIALAQSGSPGKATSVFLRGSNSSHVLVLIDGIQINNPYFGGVNFEEITTDNIERIEVIKGPQSPLYGSDSIGGVIQIITRKGSEDPSVQASFEAGSFNTYREKAAIHGNEQDFDYSLTFSRQDSEGILENDEFNENVFSARAGYDWSDHTGIDVTGRLYDSKAGIPFDAFFNPVLLQNQDSDLRLIGTNFHHLSGNLINLKASLSLANRDYHFEDPENAFQSILDTISDSWLFSLQNDFQIGSMNTLTAGYEFENQAVDAADQNGSFLDTTIRNHGIFIQDKLDTGRFILTAGFRYDHFNSFGDTVTPRVSAAFKATPGLKIRGSYGRGFRAPSAGDLAFPFYGNPDLKPEKSSSWEIGADRTLGSHATLSAVWFHNDYEDLISFDPQTLIAGNVAEAMSQGLEVSVETRFGNWRLGAAYTYLDTEDQTTGLRLFRRPEHSGNANVTYESRKWGASLSLLSIGDRLESDFSVFPSVNVLNPGFAKIDLAGSYQIHQYLRLKARFENVLDKEYQEVLGYPAPGAGFFAGLEARF
jgi:vitamin B12 transporter